MTFFPLHKSLGLRAEAVQPLNNYVLIEANEAETSIGSLLMPVSHREVYPTTGWVYAKGPLVREAIERGDLAILEEEGTHIDHTYYDVFEIVLKHEDGSIESIYADIEIEPVIREQVEAYRRGGEDRKLTCMDKKNGGSIQFDCHNVADYHFGQIANPQYDLTYVPSYMLEIVNEDDKLALFYLVHEAKILATVEY